MATIVDVKYKVDTKSLDKAKSKVKSTEKATKNFAASAAKSFKGVGIAFAAMAAAATGMFRATDQALQKLDKIGKSAQNIGIASEKFQELAFAAGQSGVSVDLFQKSMLKLSKAQVDANDGLTTTVRAFNKMGISVKDLNNNKPDEILLQVADAFSKMSDPVEQSAAAMAIFGTRGADMIELLKKGKSGITELSREARNMGLIFSQEVTDNAQIMNDKFTIMKNLVDKEWTETWAGMAEEIHMVSSALITAAKATASIVGVMGDAVNGWKVLFKELGIGLPDILPGSVEDLDQKFKALGEQIKKTQGEIRFLQADLATDIPGEGLFGTSDEEDRAALAQKKAYIEELKNKQRELVVKGDVIQQAGQTASSVTTPTSGGGGDVVDDTANQARIAREQALKDTILSIRRGLRDETRMLSIDLIKDNEIRFEQQQEMELSVFTRRLEDEKIFGEERLALLAQFDEMQRVQGVTALGVIEAEKTAIAKKGEEDRKRVLSAGLGAAASIFGSLGTLMGKAGKKQSAAQKAIAKVSIGVSTAQAIMNALTVQPYPLGVALAAGAALKGAEQLRAVGGGGSNMSAPTPISSAPSLAPTPIGTAAQQQQNQQPTEVTINNYGAITDVAFDNLVTDTIKNATDVERLVIDIGGETATVRVA